MLTDNDLADSFINSPTWASCRGRLRHWELPNAVRTFLRIHFHIPWGAQAPLDVELSVQRVTHIIRSRNTVKAAKTRAVRKRAKEKKRVEPMFL